ncbi:MAG: restriction endonuclease, partial [Lachnospiraceae bacterium]|nr:restriction endonuclease [Lachnospiraceae bacterium]
YIYGKGLDIACPKSLLPSHNKIVIPAEIKNDVKVVNKSLIEKVAQNPEILYSIQPREFEEMVCELFEKKGYKVKLTKQTHDGGKDIIVLNDSMLGDLIFYAECKRFSKNHPVEVSLVRELFGVVEADQATAGIMVTTSYYSEEAKDYRNKIKARMKLIDYAELLREVQDVNR